MAITKLHKDFELYSGSKHFDAFLANFYFNKSMNVNALFYIIHSIHITI